MNELKLLVVSWVPVSFLLYKILKSSGGSTGIPIAYFIGLLLIHLPGAAIYIIPEYSYYDSETILSGFRLTTYSMFAFVVGVWVAGRKSSISRVSRSVSSTVDFTLDKLMLKRLALGLVLVGFFVQFVLMAILPPLPSITAILSGMGQLSVVGVCIGITVALQWRDNVELRRWFLLALSYPFITLITSAFVGYGVHALVIILAFYLFFTRLTKMKVFLAVALIYMGISFFVTYMRDRSDIRESFWYEQIGYSDRMDHISRLMTDFEFFSVENENHLNYIDLRLNQNMLVGESINYMEYGGIPFLNGETILTAFIALIPRIIWPGKPEVGGGGDLVTLYTGIQFAENTSVGAGQVLEFYINFGWWGTVFCFMAFGLVVRYFDIQAASAIRKGNYTKMIFWFLPSIGFIQAGGNFAEVTTTVIASLGSAYVAVNLFKKYLLKNNKQVIASGV